MTDTEEKSGLTRRQLLQMALTGTAVAVLGAQRKETNPAFNITSENKPIVMAEKGENIDETANFMLETSGKVETVFEERQKIIGLFGTPHNLRRLVESGGLSEVKMGRVVNGDIEPIVTIIAEADYQFSNTDTSEIKISFPVSSLNPSYIIEVGQDIPPFWKANIKEREVYSLEGRKDAFRLSSSELIDIIEDLEAHYEDGSVLGIPYQEDSAFSLIGYAENVDVNVVYGYKKLHDLLKDDNFAPTDLSLYDENSMPGEPLLPVAYEKINVPRKSRAAGETGSSGDLLTNGRLRGHAPFKSLDSMHYVVANPIRVDDVIYLNLVARGFREETLGLISNNANAAADISNYNFFDDISPKKVVNGQEKVYSEIAYAITVAGLASFNSPGTYTKEQQL